MSKQDWAWAASIAAWIIAWGLRAFLAALSLVSTVAAQPQLMSAERAAILRDHLPAVDDAELRAMLADPGLLFYTALEMPGAYQDWDGALPGVHSIANNVSMVESEPHGNPNQEFPWGDPGGLHRTEGTNVFRFVRLPVQGERRLPVVWYRHVYPGSHAAGYAWLFPRGTLVGEVFLLAGPDGREYPFELRTRTRAADGWEVDTFRPFPTWESLAQRIRELEPQWENLPQLAGALRQLEEPGPLRAAELVNPHPQGTRFRSVALVDELPALEAHLVARLLTETPFQSAVGTSWRERGELAAAAPMSRAAFHVVPANYDGAFVPVDQESCNRCHENIGDHADRFDFARDWYGRVRGSDGIFSFHPFELGTLSDNGFGRPVQMRQRLVQAGLLEPYDPRRHPREVYQELNREGAETQGAGR